MEDLREQITKAIERAMLEDTGKGVGVQCRAAGYVLAIPEIAEALKAHGRLIGKPNA